MLSRKTSNQRLTKLAKYLKTVPDSNFNYSTWSHVPDEALTTLKIGTLGVNIGEYVMCILPKVIKDREAKMARSCGTTACALGWACTIPEFKKKGLALNKFGDPRLTDIDTGANYRDPFRVGQKFFGITKDDAHFLFAPGRDSNEYDWRSPGNEWNPDGRKATAEDVADHILRFVKARNDKGKKRARSSK